ncbi:hypothetical protein M989_00305 [Kluyvera georgiana ATCC 51603]|uniref:Uncharacterized protein n=1 Tax=Kluyvera georgiana ATCC 51603 TaxID=1354264 RepID=A0A1B7K7N6_9ENTR|nr:hypothetical protein M989_00305 [Kluyvera georgiana ATCC 51603]
MCTTSAFCCLSLLVKIPRRRMAKTAIAHYFHIISHKRLGCLQLKKTN